MKKTSIALVLLALLAAPALAQKGQDSPEEMDKKRQAEALDSKYKNALKRTSPDNSTPVRTDPWANMRGNEPAPKR